MGSVIEANYMYCIAFLKLENIWILKDIWLYVFQISDCDLHHMGSDKSYE